MDYQGNNDPRPYVAQQFIDAIVGACNTKWTTDGYAGFGWHLVQLIPGDPIELVFQTGIPLRGYKNGLDIFGPHRVKVTIEPLRDEIGKNGPLWSFIEHRFPCDADDCPTCREIRKQ